MLRIVQVCPLKGFVISYLLTYLLTPWCRFLLEKLTGRQLVKLPAFHGTQRFITALTSVRHLSLSWASPIQFIYTHPTSWRFILILSAHLRLGLPSGLLPSGFPPRPCIILLVKNFNLQFIKTDTNSFHKRIHNIIYSFTLATSCASHTAYVFLMNVLIHASLWYYPIKESLLILLIIYMCYRSICTWCAVYKYKYIYIIGQYVYGVRYIHIYIHTYIHIHPVSSEFLTSKWSMW